MSVKGLGVTWNGATLASVSPNAYCLSVRRRMVGAVRNVRVPVPGRDGSFFYEERRGTRIITADFTVVSDDIATRRADVVNVADWLDYTGEAQLLFSDQTDRYWRASLLTDPDPDEWKLLSKFKLEWEAQSYAYDTGTSVNAVSALVAAGSSGTFSILDEIDAYTELSISPVGGTMVTFDLNLNGSVLTWGGLILAGEFLNVSSISDTITSGVSTDTELTGAYDPAFLTMASAAGQFGVLIPGLNSWSIGWSGTATSLLLEFRWRRRYR